MSLGDFEVIKRLGKYQVNFLIRREYEISVFDRWYPYINSSDLWLNSTHKNDS